MSNHIPRSRTTLPNPLHG